MYRIWICWSETGRNCKTWILKSSGQIVKQNLQIFVFNTDNIWYLPMFADKVTAVSDNPTMRIQVRNVKTVLLASLSATQWWWLLPTSPFQWQETGDCISKGRRRKFQCQCQEIGDCIYERSNVNIRKLEIVKDDAASKFYLSINLVQFGYCLSTLPSKAPMNGVWSVSMSMSGSWR